MAKPPYAGLLGIGRALRHRNYRLFFGGQMISLVGTWMQSVAQSWLVYRLTGSSVLLGLVGFCGQIPVLLLAPWGGVLADRWRRHRIIVASQTAAMVLAFVLSALTLSGAVRPVHVFVLATLVGVVNAFDIPARQAFVVQMVGKEDLMNALALNSSIFNAARILGPAMAGVLVAAVGEGFCFVLNGASFLAVIAGLLAMRELPGKGQRPGGSALASLAEGFAFAARTGPIRTVLLLIALVSLTGMPYSVLMPIFADRVLHAGAPGLGILMAASGVGALAGALLLAAKKDTVGLGRRMVTAALAFGVGLVLFSLSQSFWVSVLLLLPIGLSMITQFAAANTLIQTMVPDVLRGRVMAVYSMMFQGSAPFGALLAGTLAARIGPTHTVALGGAVCSLGAMVLGWRLLRKAPLRANA